MASIVAVRAAAPAAATARHALLRVAAAAVLANSTWFSATAVLPALQRDWGFTAAGAWLADALPHALAALPRYASLSVDGVHVLVRLGEDDRLCLLVVIGVREDAIKELLLGCTRSRGPRRAPQAACSPGPRRCCTGP